MRPLGLSTPLAPCVGATSPRSRQQFFEKSRLQQLCLVLTEVAHAEEELQRALREEAEREEKLVGVVKKNSTREATPV